MLQRHSEPIVLEALADTRIVIVQGPRQAGKTTLVNKIVRETDGLLVSLDDAAVLEFAKADPAGFLAQAGDRVLAVDELQRAPELFLEMKLIVDRDTRPGQFLVTGSADLLRLPATGDSLAGRTETIQLLGFSQGEIAGRKERFIDRLLGGELFHEHVSSLTRHDYLERATAGGYPEALSRPPGRRREKWFDDYLSRIVERDARDISRSRRLDELPLILSMIAARNACELNYTDIAKEAGMADNAVRRLVEVLESLYLIQRIPAWFTNATKRAASRPKVSLLDSGLAASSLNVSAAGVAPTVPSQAPLAGQLLEGFVSGELKRQSMWADERARIHHFRDRSAGEVDVLLATRDGRVAGIEVKASASVTASDFTGLRRLRDVLGDRFIGGVVLHSGAEATPFSSKLSAVPIDALWSG